MILKISKKLLVDQMEELQFQSANIPKWLRKSYAHDKPLLKSSWNAATQDSGSMLFVVLVS